ncbi:MAG TPA: 1-(5-phosphoribosyl)-5-[(5-phosphoribosylamino)methylideneamino] imidazole-4-carboxamide isomerase [Armatimonadaceae bacterium]|nr:1-(5-phosphoribosyl)-5-[(5-phosphoribosylamino)methylideneamino] imidazole-4-carboxamide isomerase [Armatimonadaceae bacterium]
MPLEIIPVIELRNGKALLTRQGATGAEARVPDDALKVAKQFVAAGATRLHVIDLDGERVGSPQNLPVVRDLVRKAGVPVQAAGGLKTLELAERVLSAGADRIVLGTTAASRDDAYVVELLHRHGEKVIVEAVMKDGFMATEAWTTRGHETVQAFAQRLATAGARRFLFADAGRESLSQGVNLRATVAFAGIVGVPVLASAGVVSKEDLKSLAAVQPEGVEGVLIGKALYTGALTVADALAIAGEGAAAVS